MIMQLTRGEFVKIAAGSAFAAYPWAMSAQNRDQRTLTGGARRQRIEDVEIYAFNIPLTTPFRVALGTISVAENVLVRIRTNEGVTGWGEASPYSPVNGETQQTDVAVAPKLAAVLHGRDPFAIASANAEMDRVAVYNPSMKACLEMAMWDICGKIAGQPVYRLLGSVRDSFETDITVSLDSPQNMAEKAREFVQRGFKTLKVKLGESPEVDIERIRLVREAVGSGIKLRVDANQGWTPAQTVQALHGMEKYELQMCEQPVPYWDLPGLKHVRDNTSTPIMADEAVHSLHDAFTVLREDAVDVINIKLMKAGGILRSSQIATVAAAAGVTCMVGCMSETRLGLTAAAHVVASQANIIYADLDSFTELATDPVIGGMQLKDGIVSIPDAPGLGVDIDPTFLSKLHRA
jgi:L-alanine-DL-glutamate epimerase-like enolase superfamily enzyme